MSLLVDGPGVIIGDNPFRLDASGGVGAVWVCTISGRTGYIRIEAMHSRLGKSVVEIRSE